MNIVRYVTPNKWTVLNSNILQRWGGKICKQCTALESALSHRQQEDLIKKYELEQKCKCLFTIKNYTLLFRGDFLVEVNQMILTSHNNMRANKQTLCY